MKTSLHLLLSAWAAAVLLCCAAGCKPTTPGKYLQPDELQDVLYDYHLALGMLSAENRDRTTRAYDERLYKLAVLKKHGISEEDFDKSMQYYMRNADKLEDVYKELGERVKREADKVGANVNTMDGGGTFSEDTANIWQMAPGCVLTQQEPNNVISFSIEADTAFHKGDRFNLGFDACFLFQEGYKDGVALLAIRLSNDSVITRNLHFSSATRYNLDVEDRKEVGIKEVKGFIMLSKERETTTSTTLKVLVIDRIQLVRMHKSKTEEAKDKDTESEKVKDNPPAADNKPADDAVEKAEKAEYEQDSIEENIKKRHASKHIPPGMRHGMRDIDKRDEKNRR